jgi:hypothetical protein
MPSADALADGEAMLELGADDMGADDADDPDVVPEPPQAVRLSSAAAATPATAKVVRLIVCMVNSPCAGRPLSQARIIGLR